MEKARLPSPAERSSYQRHRRELWTKILAPMLVTVALMIAVATLTGIATFRDNGDVARWAAISTIWVVIPIMGAGLLVLIIFIGSLYGMARLLALIPPYTGYAQKLVWRAEGFVKRATDAAVQPIVELGAILATIRRMIGSK
jgi:heme/copper-type cytochrome/quinol oxidase subunit 2